MTETADRLKRFVSYWETLSGDEKGEAQVFFDRLFEAFGHAGCNEAGATLEHRVKRNGDARSTSFADLVGTFPSAISRPTRHVIDAIQAPGLPRGIKNPRSYVTDDCVAMR